jgi:hypothetical protein
LVFGCTFNPEDGTGFFSETSVDLTALRYVLLDITLHRCEDLSAVTEYPRGSSESQILDGHYCLPDNDSVSADRRRK